MTALRKYDRLETTGLWRAAPDAQLREVVVGLRDATVVLSDPKTEMPLSAWSLPALLRLNPGKTPALFTPGDDAAETLELQDPEMIAALETVRREMLRRRPRSGRLRGVMLGGSTAALVVLALFWLPERLTRYTGSVLPYATRAALGDLVLADLYRLTGSACDSKPGVAAALTLGLRVNPDLPPFVVVVREGLVAPLHLPGGVVVLPASLLELIDGPEAVAGYVLAETLRARAADPVIGLLHHAGLGATIRLLTTGAMQPASVAGYAEVLLRQTTTAPPNPPTPAIPDADLLASFTAADLSTSPYAFAVDPTGKTTLPLIEADPFLGGSPRPILSDGDWLNLQAICG